MRKKGHGVVVTMYLQGKNGDTDLENGLWTHRGKQTVRLIERVAWTNVHYHVDNRHVGKLLGDTGSAL